MIRAVTAVIHKYLVECLFEMFRSAEILVVTVALAGQERMHAVVKIVAPDTIETVAAEFRRIESAARRSDWFRR